MSRQCSGVEPLKLRPAPKPAFANATSIRPYSASVRSTIASWSGHSVTSHVTASPPSSAASASSFSVERAASTTW